MALRRRFQFSTRSKRSTTWGLGVDAIQVAVSATGVTLWTNRVDLQGSLPVTLVRLRGYFQIQLLSVGAGADGFLGAIGIGLMPTEALIAGATAVPGPLTDSDFDGWLYHHFFVVTEPTAAVVGSQTSGFNVAMDSKAMRKWDESLSLFGATELTELGTASAEFNADSRLLIKT